ncbi:MAG: hypothetical protein ACK5CA_04640 [Cyanobacteriota bacterium]|jgi:hypothetical protein
MTSPDDNLIEGSIKHIHLAYTKLMKAKASWNIREYKKARQSFRESFVQITENQGMFEELEDNWLSNVQKELDSSSYSELTESLFRENKIVYSGQFPDYVIPPFKLSFNLARNIVKLTMGKKSHQTSILEPKHLSDWITQHYNSVVSSPFDREQFCEELILAYKYLSNSIWMRQISLKDVYKLLTVRIVAKQEYPEANFMFDLARLLKVPYIEFKEFCFEFSANKESKNNYFITDDQGKEKTVGLVSIYPKQSGT